MLMASAKASVKQQKSPFNRKMMFGGGLSAKACALDYLREEGPGLWVTASPRYLKLSFQRRLKEWSWSTTPVVS